MKRGGGDTYNSVCNSNHVYRVTCCGPWAQPQASHRGRGCISGPALSDLAQKAAVSLRPRVSQGESELGQHMPAQT